jgi:hypothetical protein
MSLGKQNPFDHLKWFNLSWRLSGPQDYHQKYALTQISRSQRFRCDKFNVR